MIKVEQKPKPSDFDSKVKNPGLNFLKTIKYPKGKQWKGKDYWCRVLPDMRRAYKSICAYSSLWLLPHEKATIDHYVPKSDNPSLAYEWSNFRLANLWINSCKHTYNDVLDPFTIGDDWFILDFTTFLIKPNPDLPKQLEETVLTTIERLKLNHNDYIESRQFWFDSFKNDTTKLSKKAPFIAYEIERQRISI